MQERTGRILSSLASVRLTVVLLSIIILISILGTLIPQQQEAREFVRRLPGWLAKIYVYLEVYDIFRAPWFGGLLGLFSLNLALCTWLRFPRAWRLYRAAARGDEGDPVGDPELVYSVNRPLAEETARVEGFYRKRGYLVSKTEEPHKTRITFSKGAISYLGPYIIHAGLLLIVAGALIGVVFGFKGFVNIREGETVDSFNLLSRPGGMKALGFSVRCDKFTVEFYETGQPKLFKSDLSILSGDQVIKQVPLLVNHPLEYQGIRFYQASYETEPESAGIIVRKGSQVLSEANVNLGEPLELAEQGLTLEILRLEGNLMDLGPAAKIQVSQAARVRQMWLFQYAEEINRVRPGFLKMSPLFNTEALAPFSFSLNGMKERYKTGLQVNRDPGSPVVFLGSVFIILGLALTYFYYHRLMLVVLEEKDGETSVAGTVKLSRYPGRAAFELGLLGRMEKREQ